MLKSPLNRYLSFLDHRGKTFHIVIGFICTLLLGGIDYLADIVTGMDFTLAFFYLLPVSFVAWFAGRNAGIIIALACAATETIVYLTFNESLILIGWKSITGLGFFLVVTFLLARIRRLLQDERLQSRTDPLTGAFNYRAFVEVVAAEILRMGRRKQPCTMAYMDLDDFKKVNDSFGHATGDMVLQRVVTAIYRTIRKTDVVARLGGDEFAILFPHTDREAASVVISKVRQNFLSALENNRWETTCSIGVLTCNSPTETADEMITLADRLMYNAKRNGKNDIRYGVYPENAGTDPAPTMEDKSNIVRPIQ